MTAVDEPIDDAEGPAEVPAGLGESGAALWVSIVGDFDPAVHERLVLLQACRAADRLDDLALEAAVSPVTVENSKGDQVAHPALTESRQQSLTLARLLAALRIPDGEDDDRPQRRGGARGAYGVRKTT